MIYAELKRIHCPDVDDLSSYWPDDEKCFSLLLQAMIGPKNEDGEESFDIEVCTPKWLENVYGVDEVILGRHYLIVRKYDYEKIVQTIENYLMNCSGETWDEVAQKVSHLGRWEFESHNE